MAEVIEDGRNGLLVDFFDAKTVADRVVEALDRANEDPDGTATLRAAAHRKVVERFDLNRVCLPTQVRLIGDLRAGWRPATSAISGAVIKTPATLGA